MSKRPLLQAAVLAAAGIALYEAPVIFSLLLMGAAAVWTVVESRQMYHSQPAAVRQKAHGKARCILSLSLIPVWVGAARWRMDICKEHMFDLKNKEEVIIQGSVYDRQEKEDKTVLYLKEVQVLKRQDESKTAESAGKSIRGSCIAYYQGDDFPSIGSIVNLQGKVSLFEKNTNPGQFNAQAYYQGQGIDFALFCAEILDSSTDKNKLKEQLFQLRKYLHGQLEKLAGEQAPVLQAMLLGEKSSMDSELKELYQKCGISHILVISGLHFSLIGMCLYELLRRFGASFALAGGISVFILFLYGVMTGFGISAVRAFVMFSVSVGASVLGKTYDLPSALGASVLYLLFKNPYILFQTAFLLSAGAIVGIIAVLPALEELFPKKKTKEKDVRFPWLLRMWNTLKQGLCSGIGIQLATFPVLLSSFYEFSPYSLLLNCIVIPLMPVVVLGGIAGMVLGCFVPVLGRAALLPSTLLLKGYEAMCRLTERLPCSVITAGKPQTYRVILYYILLAVFLAGIHIAAWRRRKRAEKQLPTSIHRKIKKAAACVLFLAAAGILLLWRPKRGLQISMLDVGQGQAVYIRSGHMDILYDGGSSDVSEVGKYRIVPFLKAGGVDCLELVVVSHMDADHYNGVQQMLEEDLLTVDTLMLPWLAQQEESAQELIRLAEERRTNVLFLKAGDVFSMETSDFTVLHPAADFQTNDTNDTSAVLRLEYGDFSMLLTGDVEQAGEEDMLKNGVVSHAKVLQVAHHGSSSSTEEKFLKSVSPELALISCGKDNRYGHPAADTLSKLKNADCPYHITMEEGCLNLTVIQ